MIEKSELIKKINAVLAEEFEIDEQLISPEKMLMQTLSLDSLDLVDMVVLIENNFGFKFTGEDFMKISTFQSFYDYIYDKLEEVETK
jgi:acyl carrier protein